MRNKLVLLGAVLVISTSGVTGCGALGDQVRDRANEEVTKQKQKAKDKVKQEVTKAVEGQ